MKRPGGSHFDSLNHTTEKKTRLPCPEVSALFVKMEHHCTNLSLLNSHVSSWGYLSLKGLVLSRTLGSSTLDSPKENKEA